MLKCKIGIRNNLCYPSMLILFLSLRKIVEILMGIKQICKYSNGFFIIPSLIFISQFFAGFIPLYFNIKSKKISQKNSNYLGIELIQNQPTIIQPDKQIKIYALIIFASFFNYIGVIVRRNINDFHFENKIRGIQIIFSALLCYFTIRIKIYKHQIFSLTAIFIIIIFIISIDLFFYNEKFLSLYLYGIFSCSSRAFLDTTEKYLFEFDYLNPYKVLMLEGLIGCLLLPILFSFETTYDDINDFYKEKGVWKLFLLVILSLMHLILSLFKNIYRVLTIKSYSPMTRALAESIIDPFDFIYLLIFKTDKKDGNSNKNYYYIIIIIALLIISFLSFVYNDFIVLYCCGLEYNTHLEIQKRAILYENINGSIMDLERNRLVKEESNNEKAELSEKK